LKTKPLLITLISATLLTSCAPSAMVIDRSGDKFLMEKITPVGESLRFRTASGTSDLVLKNLSAFTIDASDTEVYGGDSWVRATIAYLVEESIVEQHGWVKMSSRLTGKCPGGPCELDLVKLREFDFVMEEIVDSTVVPVISDSTEATTSESTGTESAPTTEGE